jgi:hypothetical protein
MCGGRPQHHIEEEKRRAAAEAGALRQEAEKLRKAQEERMMAHQAAAEERQQEVLTTIVESAKQPVKVKTAADATTPLMSTRQKAAGKATGVASLRINRAPSTNLSTNVGTGISGVNIG